jgi:hypothetical protein
MTMPVFMPSVHHYAVWSQRSFMAKQPPLTVVISFIMKFKMVSETKWSTVALCSTHPV